MSGPIYRDPWAKREAWRSHPIFSRRAQFMNMFPGLGIAIVAFTGYVLADNLMHPAAVDKLKEEAVRGAHSPALWSSVTGDGKDKEGAGH